MKRLLLLVVSAFIITGAAFAQNREIKMRITDSRDKVVKNLEVYTFAKGEQDVTLNTTGEDTVIQMPSGDNTVSLIVGDTVYEIPVEGVDSIHIYMKNRRTFDGYSLDGGNKVTQVNSYHVDSQPWVKGAVDHAASYMYNSIADYIEARVVSVRPIRSRFGEIALTVNGNGNRPALVIVDGSPMSFDMLNASYKPWQISSIEVDRMGALWGLRGQNGVVNITTDVFRE